jgi:hypothetical protein
MDVSIIQSGSLTGSVSSTGTLQANIGAEGILTGEISSSGTLQGEMIAEKTLQGEIKAEGQLAGSVYMTPATENGNKPQINEITLLKDAWVSEEDNRHSQIVEVKDVTNKSQVDLTPDVQQLEVFYEKDVTFVTKNLSSVVTVYSVGQKPMNDYTIQVTLTEVDVPDGTAIWGVTVGTTMNPQRIVEKVEHLIPAVDDTLSYTSTNTVQNKIVAEALDKKLDSMDRAKNTDIDKLFG